MFQIFNISFIFILILFDDIKNIEEANHRDLILDFYENELCNLISPEDPLVFIYNHSPLLSSPLEHFKSIIKTNDSL